MLTQRTIVLVLVMFAGLTALIISYKWRKSQVKEPVPYEAPPEVSEQREQEVEAVRWLVQHDIRVKDYFRDIDLQQFAEQSHRKVAHVEFPSADLVTPDAISRVQRLLDVRSASFYDTGLTDDQVVTIADLSTVPELNFNYTGVTDTGLAALATLPNLTVLRLNGTKVTDAGLAALAASKLNTITLYDTAISDEGLGVLAQMEQIAMLDVQKTQVTPEGVVRFLESRPRCRVSYDPY